jgi:hypothetical protein
MLPTFVRQLPDYGVAGGATGNTDGRRGKGVMKRRNGSSTGRRLAVERGNRGNGENGFKTSVASGWKFFTADDTDNTDGRRGKWSDGEMPFDRLRP